MYARKVLTSEDKTDQTQRKLTVSWYCCEYFVSWIKIKRLDDEESNNQISLIYHLSKKCLSSFWAFRICHQVSQNMQKVFLTLPSILCFSTLQTLNLTVLEIGLHWPTVTMSPTLVLPNAGVQWAGKLWCLFSNLLYFLM